jgi:hypothetical protein
MARRVSRIASNENVGRQLVRRDLREVRRDGYFRGWMGPPENAVPGFESIASRDEFGWLHVIAVLLVDGKEASNYQPLEVRASSTGIIQIRSNYPRFFKCTRGGFAFLALMNGDFQKLLTIGIGSLRKGNTVEMLQ